MSNSLRPMGCSPPGSCPWDSQARMLEWVASSFSRGSPWPRKWTHSSCCISWIAGIFFFFLNHWATREHPLHIENVICVYALLCLILACIQCCCKQKQKLNISLTRLDYEALDPFMHQGISIRSRIMDFYYIPLFLLTYWYIHLFTCISSSQTTPGCSAIQCFLIKTHLWTLKVQGEREKKQGNKKKRTAVIITWPHCVFLV